LQQGVVGHAEAAAGKQIRLVAIVGEGPRLADQPVDDVPVVDAMFATPTQSQQFLDPLLGIPNLNTLGVLACLDPFADQPTGDRVNVALHPDGAARVHPHLQPLARFQTPWRQRSQQSCLFGKTVPATGVDLLEKLSQEGFVAGPAVEIPAATQHQSLIEGRLETIVSLLHVAVLIALACLDGLGLQPVMLHQSLVTLLEGFGAFDSWLDGGGESVRAVQFGHAAQEPQGVLHPFTEAFQALGEAHRARLPVGVSQDKVVDHVVERTAVDGHAEVGAVGEVAGGQATGMMHLGEEDLFGRSLLGTPGLAPPLQSPQETVAEAAWETPLQVGQKGLGLEFGVQSQEFFESRPDVGENIGSSQPVPIHGFDLAGKLAEQAILASGLGIHARLGSSQFFRRALPIKATELPHLRIGDHRTPPCKEAQ
jgi:hypothetical protein